LGITIFVERYEKPWFLSIFRLGNDSDHVRGECKVLDQGAVLFQTNHSMGITHHFTGFDIPRGEIVSAERQDRSRAR
jgi:hypothetical protein